MRGVLFVSAERLRFIGTCVDLEDGSAIQAMVDASISISRRAFLARVDRAMLVAIEEGLGYERHPRRGLTMAGDWHVSYHRSSWRGIPCLYFRWSAIEHVFC